ncbi:MAG TPA: hypothetical protein VIF15_17740 [Polyangiaceae bacterium]
MKTAAQWKTFYAAERAALGELGLAARLEQAPEVPLPARGALVFPHTMLAATGHLTAAVANAVVRSGADQVLALGVLHGGREEDAELVRSARAGDRDSQTQVRRVFQGGQGSSDPLCAEEFSLDGFTALLALAAARAGKTPPRVHARYPFLVGDDPAGVPGVDELARLREAMPVVATTDPIHHGAGYGTPEGKRQAEGEPATLAWARACIASQLALLGNGDWTRFARLAADVRSDFRDVGPVLGHLLRSQGVPEGEILELRLVDYAEVLGAESPTWVAGPLMRLG